MVNFGKLLESIATLLWPVLFAIVVFASRDTIREIFASAKSRKFTIKVAGQELTMEEANDQQTRLVADVQSRLLAVEKRIEALHPGQLFEPTAIVGQSPVRSILWVDDNPKNNATLVQHLSERGIKVVTADSTSDGLSKFSAGRFDRIITDMGRTERGDYNPTAGVDLIKAIRERDPAIPIIVYCSWRAAQQHMTETLAAGAKVVTSSPTSVIDALELG